MSKIGRLVDRIPERKIIAFTEGKRVVLFEEDNYPEDGIFGLTKAKVEKALKKALEQ